MELRQALENIRCLGERIPEEETRVIRARREEAIPTLLEYVKEVNDGSEDTPKEYDAYAYAMFLLAEFRVREAFPHLIRYLEYSGDFVEYLLGDMLTEDFGQILASVAGAEDVGRIMVVAENASLDSFHRNAAIRALRVLYVEDALERESYYACLRRLLDVGRDDCEFLSMVVDDCRETGCAAFLPIIEPLFNAGLVDEDFIMYSEAVQDLTDADEDAAKALLKRERWSVYIDDALARTGPLGILRAVREPRNDWKAAALNTPRRASKAVGRNDPCPCGSGRKFKRCCGG